MKRFVIMVMAAVFVISAGVMLVVKDSQAADKSMLFGKVEADASLVIASPPASDFDNGIGITIGAGMLLPVLDNKLQGRVDLTFVTWDASVSGIDLTYSRNFVTVSGRYYFPLKVENLKLYAQGGLEVSFDKVDTYIPIFGKASASETNLGVTPGGGIDYALNKNLSIVGDLRYHIITDPYFTVQGGVAYKF